MNLRQKLIGILAITSLGVLADYAINDNPHVKTDYKASRILVSHNPKQEVKNVNSVYDRFHQSSDYQPGRSKKVSEIVLHTTEGSGSGAENWLTTKDKTSASAHYLIMENGEIVGLVKDRDTAYHCRKHNDISVGIEFAGYYDKNLSSAQVKAGQKVITFLMKNYNIPKSQIKAHSDLDSSRRKDPGKKNMEAILSGVN